MCSEYLFLIVVNEYFESKVSSKLSKVNVSPNPYLFFSSVFELFAELSVLLFELLLSLTSLPHPVSPITIIAMSIILIIFFFIYTSYFIFAKRPISSFSLFSNSCVCSLTSPSGCSSIFRISFFSSSKASL